MFAREYNQTARNMPFVIAKKQVPQNLIKRDEKADKVLTFLNISAPIIEGVGFFLIDCCFHPNALFWTYISAKLAVVILQLVSAVFLGFAIFKIRKYIKEGGQTEQVDVIQLVKHFSAFGLYLVSSLVLIVFYILYFIFQAVPYANFNEAYDCRVILSCISQLCLCWIFWHLSKKEPKEEQTVQTEEQPLTIADNQNTTHHSLPEIIVEEYDERSDVQARIWN